MAKSPEEELKQEETVAEAEEAVEETAEAEETEETAEPSAEDKVKEWEDKYLRLLAEFDNFKKRTQREKDARYADAVIETVAEILAVTDNLERALAVEVTGDEAKKLHEGVGMVYKQMQEIFAKLGVAEIKALGEQFDPNLHNAVMHMEDETIDDNTVVEEFMKGYIYKENRVIRHSMVKVAN